MSSSEGTKVTKDPAALNDPKSENPGMVTSDSLAAESIRDGESFAADSDSRGPNAQPSYSTTTNTTDTSSAIRLDPAPDAEARQANEAWSEASQMNAGSGLSAASSSEEGGGGGGNEPTASAHDAPKGKNITEGGFDADAPNASFGTDIGGKKDPGRVALEGMEEANVPVAGGAGPKQDHITNDGQFDVLKDTSA